MNVTRLFYVTLADFAKYSSFTVDSPNDGFLRVITYITVTLVTSQSISHNDFRDESLNDDHMILLMRQIKDNTFWTAYIVNICNIQQRYTDRLCYKEIYLYCTLLLHQRDF